MISQESFQDVMQEAAKLKAKELEGKRKDWHAAPQFLQSTLTNDKEVVSLRSEGIAQRLDFISEHKGKGNDLCQEKQFQRSIDEYSKALSVLLWFTLPGGRNSETIALIPGFKRIENEDERAQAEGWVKTLLLNIAHCENKLGNWAAAAYASNYVLGLDKYNVKALYRRAVANYGQGTSSSLDLAVDDLMKANSLDPDDAGVSKLLSKYYKEKVQQDRKDSRIWKRSIARKEQEDPSYSFTSDRPSTRRGRSSSSWLDRAKKNPFVSAVYLLVFLHFGYRIYLLITTPLGTKI